MVARALCQHGAKYFRARPWHTKAAAKSGVHDALGSSACAGLGGRPPAAPAGFTEFDLVVLNRRCSCASEPEAPNAREARLRMGDSRPTLLRRESRSSRAPPVARPHQGRRRGLRCPPAGHNTLRWRAAGWTASGHKKSRCNGNMAKSVQPSTSLDTGFR